MGSIFKILMSEMAIQNNEIFIMSDEEKEKFGDLLSDFGADINYLIQNDLSENSITGMPLEDKIKKKWAIKIDRGVHTRLRELIEEGIEAKDWYYNISDVIYESLGESEAVLFLLLLASTSPRSRLTTNFNEASVIYVGFKKDIEENEELLYRFIYEENADNFSYDENSKYGDLHLVRAMRNVGMKDVGAKIANLFKTFRYYYENEGNITKAEAAEYFGAFFNPYSSTVKGIVDFSQEKALQLNKVYNFSMNLLMPEYAVDIRNKKWFFVTIDSWMIRAMYPHLSDAETYIMSHQSRYLYAQEKIMQFAREFSMEPHQVQASIWVAKLREAGKSVDTFEVSIAQRIKELQRANAEFKGTYNDLKSVINEIYSYYDIQPNVASLPYDLDEEAPF